MHICGSIFSYIRPPTHTYKHSDKEKNNKYFPEIVSVVASYFLIIINYEKKKTIKREKTSVHFILSTDALIMFKMNFISYKEPTSLPALNILRSGLIVAIIYAVCIVHSVWKSFHKYFIFHRFHRFQHFQQIKIIFEVLSAFKVCALMAFITRVCNERVWVLSATTPIITFFFFYEKDNIT